MSIQKVDKTTGNTSLLAGSTNFADNPIGAILPYGGVDAPIGWMLCQGQSLLRASYPELFAVIGTAFGSADSTHFNIPDMRESVPKGAGLTGHTVGAHLDADGLAVGEFLDDRIQEHQHSYLSSYSGDVSNVYGNINGSVVNTTNMTGRSGATTEVKSVGVNYIIKAKMVALPADLASGVEELISDKCVSVDATSTSVTIPSLEEATATITVTSPNGEAPKAWSIVTNTNSWLGVGFHKVTWTKGSNNVYTGLLQIMNVASGQISGTITLRVLF